jgi:lipid II:glycine glycyltransferase (peptidoglycan interpeptide bridge formation enzyme)
MLFSEAPKRLEVFSHVNGKLSAKEISMKTGKPLNSSLNDLLKMKDLELISPKCDKAGKTVRKNDSIVYEKVPLIRHIPISYFTDSTKVAKEKVKAPKLSEKSKSPTMTDLHIPSGNEVLDLCRAGEDQIHEFKAAGTEIQKLTKEIAAFANTKLGGLIFYGVEDDGTITGSDKRKQEFDQSLQNSVRNTISPSLTIDIEERDILGYQIIIIRIPAWSKKDVYHYDGRVYIRRGTNAFMAKPEDSKKLHSGKSIV